MESSCICVDFLRLSLTSNKGRSRYHLKRVCSLDERERIKQSSHDCQLCREICNFLRYVYQDQYDLSGPENEPFVSVGLDDSHLHDDKNLVSSITLSCHRETTVIPNFSNMKILSFAIWADQGAIMQPHSNLYL